MSGGAVSEMLKARVQLSDAQYEHLSGLVRQHLGIRMGADKRGMLESRLLKVMNGLGVTSVAEMFERHLRNGASTALLSQLVDHVTTSHSHFHREAHHFDFLIQTSIPAALRRRAKDKDLRVWCAAAATGEEPYELAMILRDHVPDAGSWQAGVLATDISARALDVARAARYSDENVERLPAEARRRYLEQLDGGRWEVRESLRRDVTFRRLNLLDAEYPFRREFDAIFCRNVLMYFDDDVRRAVVHRLQRWLAPGGHLFVGHTETLTSLGTRLTLVGAGIYKL